MSLIPGFKDEEIAHLSPRQREQLAMERKGGRAAVQHHKSAQRYAESQRDRLNQEQEDQVLIDAELIQARRTAERKLAETRAREQQEVNSRVNAEKEAADQNETRNGREVVPADVRAHIADAAAELVQIRTDQAREIGLTEQSTLIGHPDASEGQAAAAQANTEKEIADREQSANYSAAEPYQGATGETQVGIKNAQFDDEGNLIEQSEQSKADTETAQETGAENNGQANQTSEPSAADLAIEGITPPSGTRRRRGSNPGPRAVGDGPSSE